MQYRFQNGEKVYTVDIERHGDSYTAQVDGESYELQVLDSSPGQISLNFAGHPVTLYWASDGAKKWVSQGGCTYRLEKPAPRSSQRSADGHAGTVVRSPMPASVRTLQVSEGEQVEKGQTLLLLEAMKMEIRVKAPAAGKVAKIPVSAGQTVEKDQTLVEMEGE